MTTLKFGNTLKMVEALAPDLPFSADRLGYSEEFTSEGGGLATQQSQGFAKKYPFNFEVDNADTLSVYERFRQGSYGSGLLYFANPFAFHTNLFSPAWAEPGLIEGGDWPNIFDVTPSFSNVAANSYDQPIRKATWAITTTANTAPSDSCSTFILPIPSDQTLHLGVSGAATGTAVVHCVAHNIGAGTSASSDLTLLSETASTRLNASFSGASYDYVAVDFRRTTSAASTLTIASMLAQLWPTGSSPALTGLHRSGDGHTGLRFVGETYKKDYRLMLSDEYFTGVSFVLAEVGAWLQ